MRITPTHAVKSTRLSRHILLAIALVGLALGSCVALPSRAHDLATLKAMDLPALRELGPVNPIKNPNAGSYRKWTRTYCELGLLNGVQCTQSIEGHHFVVTHAQMIAAGKSFAAQYTNQHNLVSLCDVRDCQLCGQACHLMVGHLGNYTTVNGAFVFMYRSQLIVWIMEQSP